MFQRPDEPRTQNSVAPPLVLPSPLSEPDIQAADSIARKAFVVGSSPAMAMILKRIERFAACDDPVVITGESGAGKESAARAIHERSCRARQPFIAIDCTTLASPLFSSRLFGYEKGAFNGARARRRGLIEHANTGTLFLNEICEIPLGLQSHLLRLLKDGETVRLGGYERISVDIRLIVATSLCPQDAIAAGKLREDLYYHLNVLRLDMPAVRDRNGDVEPSARFLLRQMAHETGRNINGFTPRAMAAIQAYPWPGNVRELIASIRRALVLSNGPRVHAVDLGLDVVWDRSAEVGRAGHHDPGTRSGR